jgi:hypothetical protein
MPKTRQFRGCLRANTPRTGGKLPNFHHFMCGCNRCQVQAAAWNVTGQDRKSRK